MADKELLPWNQECGLLSVVFEMQLFPFKLLKAKRIKYNSYHSHSSPCSPNGIQITEVKFLSRGSCSSDLYSELS